MLGVGRWTVNRIAGTREYKDAEASFVLGETSKLDELLGSKQEIMRTYFASSVPAAMRALVEMVQQKSDLKARLAASVELLDRDPKRSFVTARDAVSLSRPNADGTNAPTLPESMIEEIGRKATVLEQNALREALGPSGKPN